MKEPNKSKGGKKGKGNQNQNQNQTKGGVKKQEISEETKAPTPSKTQKPISMFDDDEP